METDSLISPFPKYNGKLHKEIRVAKTASMKHKNLYIIIALTLAVGLIGLFVMFVNRSKSETRYEKGGQKLIIDSDGGVDDAFAILMILSKQDEMKINVLFVSTISGNTDLENVTRNVLTTINVAGKLNEVPVYMGAASAIMASTYSSITPYFFGRDGLGDTDIERKPVSLVSGQLAAVEMIKIVQKLPGEVDILCIGPLTNIALAMKLYPNFINDVRRLFILGGSIDGNGNIEGWKEYNFAQDPEAANIVFTYITNRKSKSEVFVLPWEPVQKMGINWQWRNNVLGKIDSKPMKFLNEISTFFKGSDTETWAEADVVLASVYLDYKNVVQETLNIGLSVATCPKKDAGNTVLDKLSDQITVISNLNSTAYKNLLIRCFE